MAEQNEIELVVQPELVWEHFTIRDGLPDMKIECIYEDRHGLVWVGTHEGGLACYDGYGFKIYTMEDGLAGNGVFSAIEDDQGCMWFGTNRGLCRFNGTEFEAFVVGGESRSFLWARCKDKNGRLWFGLEREPRRGPAICCWDGDVLKEIVLDELEEGLEDVGESINAMDVDEKGRIWCGGIRLFVCEIPKKNKIDEYKVTNKSKEYDHHIASIVCIKNETWIGTSLGIVSHTRKTNNIEYMVLGDGGVNGLLYNKTESICYAFSDTGYIWSIDLGENRQVVGKKQGKLWQGGLGGGGRVIWMGTYGMGFYRINLHKILLYKLFSQAEFVVEGKSNIYVYCQNAIVEFDGSKNTLQRVEVTISNTVSFCDNIYDKSLYDINHINWSISNKACCCVYDKQSASLIIGTVQGAIYVINKSYEVVQIILASISGYRVNYIGLDRCRRIWYTSVYGNTIGYIDCGRHVVMNKQISAMCVGKSGDTYIAEVAKTRTLIIRVDTTRDEQETLGELLGVDVMVLCETDIGLWLGTNSGLCLLCEGEFTFYTIDDGLSCNIVTCIKQSEDGILWIGTEGGGVCCFDGIAFQVIHIPGDVGFNIIHDIMEDNSTLLWFATESGLVQFRRDKNKPSVEIIGVDGDASYRGKRIPQYPNTMTSLSFRFKGRSAGERVQDIVYRYRLVGASPKWKQTGEEKVTYGTLPPGHYTFEVQALNRDLNYSDIEKRRIIITPDPWVAALVSESSSHLYPTDTRLHTGEVLLLDRDQTFLEYCSEFLRRGGYKVSTNSYSLDIVDELQQFDAVIINMEDFLVLSSSPKKMSGKIGAKCIVTTDFSHITRVDDVIRYGAFSYITKPFEAYQLVDKILQVIYSQKDELLLFIRNHLGSIYTREDVADTLNISPNTVSNRVRRSCKMGFSEFLQMCRVQEAQKLLVQTSLHIHQIANNVGFESHEGLTRTFKKITGYTPLQYRKKMRSVQL